MERRMSYKGYLIIPIFVNKQAMFFEVYFGFIKDSTKRLGGYFESLEEAKIAIHLHMPISDKYGVNEDIKYL